MKKYLYPVIILAAYFINLNNASAQWVQSVGSFGGIVETIVLAGGTNQALLAGSNGGGVFISTDQGMHWAPTANLGLNDLHVHALLSASGATLAGTDAGIFLSTNNGAIWLPASTGQINKDTVNALFLKADTVFAGTSHGVYRATRATLSWERADSGFFADYYIHTFIQSDTNLLAGTYVFGVWRSTNDGTSWDQSNTGLTKSDMHAFAQLDTNLFVGTDGGLLFVSNDNGHIWNSVSVNFNVSSINTLAFFGALYAGTDAGVYVKITNTQWTRYDGFPKIPDVRLLYASTGTKILAALGDSTIWSGNFFQDVQQKDKKISIENYPNPFTQQTTIKFSSSNYGIAKVSIINSLGEVVAQLFNGSLDVGEHSVSWDAHAFAVGMYWCIVNDGGEITRLPLVVVR